jgi:cysteinyl-tRNA synthetase
MLATHYRQPINWTARGVAEAGRTLDNWYELAGDATPGAIDPDVDAALADDLNTPRAIAALHDLRGRAAHGDQDAAGSLKASAALLGLLQEDNAAWRQRRRSGASLDETEIEAAIQERLAARAAKDFATSDRIRDDLAAKGIQLKDGKDPATGEAITTWEIKRD